MTAGFLNDPSSCLLARLRCLGSIWLSGRWNWSPKRSKQLSEAHKRLPERSKGCLEATICGPDAQKAPKIASETLQRAPGRAFRAPGRSWRALNNEKPQKHYGFSSFRSLEQKSASLKSGPIPYQPPLDPPLLKINYRYATSSADSESPERFPSSDNPAKPACEWEGERATEHLLVRNCLA